MVIRTHNPPSTFTYLLNNSYNCLWLWANSVRNHQTVSVDQFKNESESNKSAEPFVVTWLKNLDRLIRMLELNKSSDTQDFNFADIGCGTGVVCLYAASKYPFESILGLDFEPDLIHKAHHNLDNFKGKIKTKEIHFIEGDAAVFDLAPKRYFLFLFNPFGADILTSFVDRNVETLSEKKSVIAYSNDKHVEIFNNYPCAISRDDKHNVSLISF